MALGHLHYHLAKKKKEKGLQILISLSDFRKSNHIKESCFVSYKHIYSFKITFENFMATNCDKN